ncbi:MAG TPA: hypothetical protein VFZ23_09940 [Pyrinomonadaceae bacterium]
MLALSSCFLSGDSPHGKPLAYTAVTTLSFSDSDPKLGEPFGIAVRDGDIYVSDGESGSVVKFGRDGKSSVFATGLHTPSALAFSPAGELIVADTGSHTIKSIGTDGVLTLIAGIEGVSGATDGQAGGSTFNAPVGLAVAADGAIYVADTYNDRIRLILDGNVTTVAGSSMGFADGPGSVAKFDTPLGLAVWQDKILVADSGNRRIRVIETNGDVWTLAGSGEDEIGDGDLSNASFGSPTAIAPSTDGRVFVADGNAIRVIGRRAFPFVETIAGQRRGFVDGHALQARFNRPSGFAIGPAGELLVADSENQVVRVISDGDLGRELRQDEISSRRMTAGQFRDLQPPRWPYDPPNAVREVAGTLGEIRGEIGTTGRPVWFHNGFDIAGAYGETAKFIRTETVLDPHSAQNFGTGRELLRLPTIGYIHLRLGRDKDDTLFPDPRFRFERDSTGELTDVRVPRGAKFAAGDAIGTLNAQNHVHLIAGRAGAEMNALAALSFPGISDAIPPVIEGVALTDSTWQEIETESGQTRINQADKLRIIVQAYDRMDGNADRRRLGVYRLGYQLFSDGSPQDEIDWTISFDRMPSNDAVPFVYARGSRSGATGVTVFKYIASNRISGDDHSEAFLDLTTQEPGKKTLRVYAADFFGNIASKDITFEVVK